MSWPASRVSVVERTRSGDEETRRTAFATIIDAYWKPVYKYLRVRWSLGPDEAADVTRNFFTTALEKDVVRKYDPGQARFRTHLRLCLDAFATNGEQPTRRTEPGDSTTMTRFDFASAEREVTRHEPPSGVDVDELFYREWARALLERCLVDLKRHADVAGRSVMFDVFARYDLVDDVSARPTYADIARTLALTPATVTNHLAAMRRQYRSILLEWLRELTSSDEEWEVEAAGLLDHCP